jgi:hypothetical protein
LSNDPGNLKAVQRKHNYIQLDIHGAQL